jgi:hypothetical protein
MLALWMKPRKAHAVVASPLEKRGFGKGKTLSLRLQFKK